jgi:hypothetical protein
MTVNLFKPSGETDTLFNVTDIHVNHENRVLTVMFKVNGSVKTICFAPQEWTSFITSH